jgi:hypothetical protein
MSERLPKDQYPTWVKLSLWGLSSRASVIGFAWLSVVVALGLVGYGVWRTDVRYYLGIAFLAAAYAYWRAAVWVDRHGSWPER